jgi:periplasmic divalent cation tolerance protein
MPAKKKSEAIIVYCTAGSAVEARRLVDTLVGEKLAACVSLLPQVKSTYWWKGKIERGEESLLVIKTTKARFTALAKRIKDVHSYSVPEILALPIVDGNPDYLKWLNDCV